MKTLVRDLLESKGRFVLTINAQKTALEALQKMVDQDVGSILVKAGDEIRGIFSDRDFLRRVVLNEDATEESTLNEVMTSEMIVVSETDSVQECMNIMTQKRIRHLPVVEQGELKGIISIGDCVKSLSRQDEVRIKQLQSYISGDYPG